MAKIKMNVTNDVTFYEGCEEYILDCKTRNLRNGTLRYYTDSSKQIMKYIGEDTLMGWNYYRSYERYFTIFVNLWKEKLINYHSITRNCCRDKLKSAHGSNTEL